MPWSSLRSNRSWAMGQGQIQAVRAWEERQRILRLLKTPRRRLRAQEMWWKLSSLLLRSGKVKLRKLTVTGVLFYEQKGASVISKKKQAKTRICSLMSSMERTQRQATVFRDGKSLSREGFYVIL